ncbi:MAG: transcription antitermination factor NusB [Clostridiales bacterium]|nr:transcription antitermination factor NusB [Clostridiales bacterium]
MGRRASREIAMKLLYQLEIQKDDRESQIRLVLEESSLSEKETKYVSDIVDQVFKNLIHIDKTIEVNSKGWKIGRISKVDLSIMRLSICEVLYMDDIPYSVSVNEAVELAKKYSGEEAGAFINGILSKVSKIRLIPLEKSVAAGAAEESGEEPEESDESEVSDESDEPEASSEASEAETEDVAGEAAGTSSEKNVEIASIEISDVPLANPDEKE